jgi:hypothetical protein
MLQQKEQMRHQRREADEESVARQEEMRRKTLEYQAQLKASVKQQEMDQASKLAKDVTGLNHAFISQLTDKNFKEKRES